jgi:phosphoserine phosphatase
MEPESRHCRLICFDVDGTLLDNTVFIWDTLHNHFATDPEKRQWAWNGYFSGRLSYRDWFFHDLELLKQRGATRDTILGAFREIRVMPGAREALATLRRKEYRLAVISGSIDLVLERFFPPGSFDHVLINRIVFDSRGTIAGGEATPYDVESKAEGLRELCRREGISTAEAAFVGDHFNDVPVARAAGFSIGFNLKSDALRDVVDVIIERKDLREILAYF